MKKRPNIVKKCCKNINLSDKKSKTNEKRHKNVNLGDKKSQTQGIIQNKSATGSRMLLCLVIFF